jgi:hypothetical protein
MGKKKERRKFNELIIILKIREFFEFGDPRSKWNKL